ncbi:MAG: hypothetical protein WDW38_002105 [Sanguina aurantia]
MTGAHPGTVMGSHPGSSSKRVQQAGWGREGGASRPALTVTGSGRVLDLTHSGPGNAAPGSAVLAAAPGATAPDTSSAATDLVNRILAVAKSGSSLFRTGSGSAGPASPRSSIAHPAGPQRLPPPRRRLLRPVPSIIQRMMESIHMSQSVPVEEQKRKMLSVSNPHRSLSVVARRHSAPLLNKPRRGSGLRADPAVSLATNSSAANMYVATRTLTAETTTGGAPGPMSGGNATRSPSPSHTQAGATAALCAVSAAAAAAAAAGSACHGRGLTGVQPDTPALVGLPYDYISSQLGSWRTGTRTAAAPDCMAHIATHLTPDDITAVSAWLANQQPPAAAHAQAAGSVKPPLACGVLGAKGDGA